MPPHSPSIRHRLLSLSLSLLGLLWLLAISLMFAQTYHEISEVFDAHLIQDARTLARLPWATWQANDDTLHIQPAPELLQSNEDYHQYEKSITFLVRNQAGQFLARTQEAPDLPVFPAFSLRNYNTQDDEWRVFTLLHDTLIIQTAEPYKTRQAIVYQSLYHVLYVALLALPLFALAVWWTVGYSFRPLNKLVTELGKRHADQLHALDEQRAPQEIHPLVNALNALFARVEGTFNNERRFTADAAHELRTPLAGLKTQVEVALNAQDAAQQQAALQQLLSGLDRANHLVAQLLTLARVDAQTELPKQAVSLDGLLQDLISELLPQALAKQIDLGVENRLKNPVLQAHYDSFYLMLRNFVENALRYTPVGGHVTLHVQNSDTGVSLCVEDNGCGIPAKLREQVFERFYRGEHPSIKGSGLGLSIAKRIADLHGWQLHLDSRIKGQGLRVWILLNAPSSTDRL